MKSDAEIRDDVINELQWDPQVTDPEAIGVAVKDGAVTLTGHVPSYAAKLAAARAAERVYGVKAVANDLKVQFARAPRDDSDIAKAVAHILEWNVQIPEGKVHARVENGWVTLDGEVSYDYQRREVERMVRQVRGVIGVTDTITVKPPASPQKVQEVIKDYQKIFTGIVKQGQASGDFVSGEPDMLVNAVLGMCNWIYRWYHPETSPKLEAVKKTFIELIMGGIVKRDK